MTADELILLLEVRQALEDWIVTYAADHCKRSQVMKAWERLLARGGTIACVSDLRERIDKALTP